jgi:hypothetical protein
MPADPSRAAVELHCTELIATPDLPAASGWVELRSVASPFGVSVTVDGKPRRSLVITIQGLPPVETLGAYVGYVAWATPLSMDSIIRLGEVRNGRTAVGEVTMEQYRILISAEPSVRATTREGRLVLRGTSPGVRLLAHRDLLQPSTPGAVRDLEASRPGGATTRPPTDGHAAHAAPDTSTHTVVSWGMPPMPSWMRPGWAHTLVPASPFSLFGSDRVFPLARPSELVRLTVAIRLTWRRASCGARSPGARW